MATDDDDDDDDDDNDDADEDNLLISWGFWELIFNLRFT